MYAVGVTTTHPAGPLWDAGADEVVENLGGYDVRPLVARLRGPAHDREVAGEAGLAGLDAGEPEDDAADQLGEHGGGLLAGLEHLLVVIGMPMTPAAAFVTRAKARHVHPGVPGDDRLGDGGHADDVGPERREHPDLGGRLVARAGQAGVNASRSR